MRSRNFEINLNNVSVIRLRSAYVTLTFRLRDADVTLTLTLT